MLSDAASIASRIVMNDRNGKSSVVLCGWNDIALPLSMSAVHVCSASRNVMTEVMPDTPVNSRPVQTESGDDYSAAGFSSAQDDYSRLSALYEDYVGRLSASLRKMYGNGPPDPDDIAQAAFQKVIERGDIGSIQNLKAFVWRTARNLVFKSHRAREIRSKYDFEIDGLFFALKTDELSPERVILAEEQLQIINHSLLNMPVKRRRAFLLHRLNGLSVSDVARKLGISRSTADEHITRAAIDINQHLLTMEQDEC